MPSDFVEVGEADIAVDHPMRRQRCVITEWVLGFLFAATLPPRFLARFSALRARRERRCSRSAPCALRIFVVDVACHVTLRLEVIHANDTTLRTARGQRLPGILHSNYTTRRRRLSSITRAPCRKVMGITGPTLAGGVVGGERNLIVLDAGDVLHDAPSTCRCARSSRGAWRRRLRSRACRHAGKPRRLAPRYAR
jgi:hypothetical protein